MAHYCPIFVLCRHASECFYGLIFGDPYPTMFSLVAQQLNRKKNSNKQTVSALGTRVLQDFHKLKAKPQPASSDSFKFFEFWGIFGLPERLPVNARCQGPMIWHNFPVELNKNWAGTLWQTNKSDNQFYDVFLIYQIRGTQRFIAVDICSEGVNRLRNTDLVSTKLKSKVFCQNFVTPGNQFLSFSERQIPRQNCEVRSTDILVRPSTALKFGKRHSFS